MSIPHGKIPGRVLLPDPAPDPVFHDANTYLYKLVGGQMVFKGVVMADGWENRPMGKLSCFRPKEEEDEEMAGYHNIGKARKDKVEIIEKAKQVLYEAPETSYTAVAKKLDVPLSTLYSWLKKDEKEQPQSKEPGITKYEEMLESVDEGKKMVSRKCALCEAELPRFAQQEGRFWHQGKMICRECSLALAEKTTQYEPTDNDYQETDDEQAPYVAGSQDEPVEETHDCKMCGEPTYGHSDWICENCEDFTMASIKPVLVDKPFDRQAFVLEMIETVLEHSRNNKAPAELTVELIDAVLAVA